MIQVVRTIWQGRLTAPGVPDHPTAFTMYWRRNDVGTTPATAAGIAGGMDWGQRSGLLSIMVDRWRSVGVEARIVAGPGIGDVAFFADTTRVGTAGESVIPWQAAVVFGRWGAATLPRRRGRVFIGPYSTGVVDSFWPGNQKIATGNEFLTAFRDSLKAPTIAGGAVWVPCLWHDDLGTTDDITVVTISPWAGTLRRRRPQGLR